MVKKAAYSAALVRLVQNYRRQMVVMAVLFVVVAALLAFGVSERPAAAQSEPQTVGRVTNLTTAAGQPDGTVRLTWNAAENAQVYFVYFIEQKDLDARNWAAGQMRAVNGTEAIVDGLTGGQTYYFAARGMRWNFEPFGAVWGEWEYWETAIPTGTAVATTPIPAQSEPQTVGAVTKLTAATDGYPPGTVLLTWNAAENAQVHFVYYIEQKDLDARNWAAGKMRAFNGTEAIIDGLAGGKGYYFAARGMRWNFEPFGAVWGAWVFWETATPNATVPTASLADLENGAWLEQNKPALANQLKALPWIADGVDESEREAAQNLIRAARWYPTTFNALLRLPWVTDSITTDETRAIYGIRGSARLSPLLAERILQKPWIQDDVTRDEGIIIRRLYWLARRTDDATQQRMIDVAIRIVDMPFLDDVTFAEARAVMSLHNLTGSTTQESFRAVMSHPKVQDGIADQEAKVIAVLETPARREPEMIPHLLDGLDGTDGVYLEERTIQLPLTGDTLLTIVRTQDQTTASMGYLEHAVRFNEKFMGAPLPTNYVALYFGPNAGQTYAAHNWYTHMAMGSDRDGPERKANVFAHEVAHYYFRSPGPRWIHEGAAELITFVSEYERAGYPLETHLNTPCDDIKTLPASDPDEHKPCAYFLGGSFFIDLYRTLGEDAFLQGFRALHRMRLVDNPDDDCFECTELSIHHVEAAFKDGASANVIAKVDAVIDHWYYGKEPVSLADRINALPWLADGVTEDERRAVNALREILQEAPAVAETLLGFPWLINGLTEHESWSVRDLHDISREDPAMAETLLSFRWIIDGVTEDESRAVRYLHDILREDPGMAETLLGSQWVADGVSRNDRRTLWGLARLYRIDLSSLSTLTAKPWFKDGLSDKEFTLLGHLGAIANTNADAAVALIAMPFLDSAEDRDMLALESLKEIAGRDANGFRNLMAHPRIKDGITDEETKIVAVLGGATYAYAPESAQVLLGGSAYIQERLIELPHTGETLLAVIGVQDPDPRSMDYFEHAVGSVERFMGEPYPINYLALLYYDNASQNANNNFTHLLFMGEANSLSRDSHPAVIAHEIAHWYWSGDGDEGYQYRKWITEGSADFFKIISEHERVGLPLEPFGGACSFFDSISELEKANPSREFIPGKATPRDCYYSLGERFFLDLYLALGDETFRTAFRALYHRYRQDNFTDGCGRPSLNICRVASVFKEGASAEVVAKVDAVIAHWYYGKTVTHEGDRAELTALYHATGGANWADNTNWLSDAHIGEWYGVTTDAYGRVTELNLAGNGLSGPLPSGLGNLLKLERLELNDNQLTGAIPVSLGNLTNLTRLELNDNQLTGAILPELGNLTNLTSLSLGGNQLSGTIPLELGNLTKLTSLSLSGNRKLSGPIPTWLGRFSRLRGLFLWGNQFTGTIPSELGNLSNLTWLSLSNNELRGVIPASLGSLSNLKELYLDYNQLTGDIPAQLGNLSNLTGVRLSGNQLTGCVPAALLAVVDNDLDRVNLSTCP